MGQNKMEQEFGKKLNQREITPSANSWDRLDAMLTVAENQKPRRDYSWLYVAAAILGFLLIGGIYLSNPPEMIDVRKDEVAIDHQTKDSVKSPKIEHEEFSAGRTSESVAATRTGIVTATPNRLLHKNSTANKTNNLVEKRQESIAVIEKKSEEKSNINPSIINQKTEQVSVTKVDELMANVTPAPKSGTQTSVKVNAQNLLSQVDGEVNLSFREKVLRKINRNYQEVAEAVSSRNTQQ